MAERKKSKKNLEEEKTEAQREKEKEKKVVILNDEGQHEIQNIKNNESNQFNLQPSSDK